MIPLTQILKFTISEKKKIKKKISKIKLEKYIKIDQVHLTNCKIKLEIYIKIDQIYLTNYINFKHIKYTYIT